MIKIISKFYTLEGKIKYILKYEYKFFVNRTNVIGVGFGYKRKNNFYTRQKCIQVFVVKKVQKHQLLSNDIIPKIFKGIPTDVIQTGVFSACSLTKRIRPVLGGYNVGSNMEQEYYGTVGCLVTNGVLNFVLGSNHTFANNNVVPIGTPIVQPSRKYGGFHPNDSIATLNKYIPIRFIEGEQQSINFSDCALGLLTKSNIVSSKIALIGNIKGIKKPVLEEKVMKVGSISELTEGTIISTSASIAVNYPNDRRAMFEDVIVTNSMLSMGDSGAVLVNKYNYALGMALSNSDTNSNFCSISTTLDQLDVKIVT